MKEENVAEKITGEAEEARACANSARGICNPYRSDTPEIPTGTENNKTVTFSSVPFKKLPSPPARTPHFSCSRCSGSLADRTISETPEPYARSLYTERVHSVLTRPESRPRSGAVRSYPAPSLRRWIAAR